MPTPTATAAAAVMTSEELPTSFGVFRPVGQVMVGVPSQAQAELLARALHGAGWTAGEVLHFEPENSVSELRALVAEAGPLAGFGSEIALLRRYLALAQQGYRWLLISAAADARAQRVGEIARTCGATLAVSYRRFTVEELI